MKSILRGLLSCFPGTLFLSPAWWIVSPSFSQQRIPQETMIIKKYWCWIHLFAFPKWSLTQFGCSRLSLYSSSWHRIGTFASLAAGLSVFLLAMNSLGLDSLSCKRVSLCEMWFNGCSNCLSVFQTHGKAQHRWAIQQAGQNRAKSMTQTLHAHKYVQALKSARWHVLREIWGN